LPELVRHDIHVDTSREKNVKSFPRSGNVEKPERPASPLGSEYEVVLLTFSKAPPSNEDIFHYHSAGNVSLIPGVGDFVVLRLQPERRKSSVGFYVGLVNARVENGWTIKCMRRFQSHINKFVFLQVADIDICEDSLIS
jgi:hypothetical protein